MVGGPAISRMEAIELDQNDRQARRRHHQIGLSVRRRTEDHQTWGVTLPDGKEIRVYGVSIFQSGGVMSLSKTLRLLVLVPLAISPLYGRQDLRTVSAPPVVSVCGSAVWSIHDEPLSACERSTECDHWACG